jgi:peroxiredoxin
MVSLLPKLKKLLTLWMLPMVCLAGVAPNSPAPNFECLDAAGCALDVSALRGRYVVLEWTNAACPFVKKHYSGGAMQGTQQSLRSQGVCWIQIISSAPGKQGYLTPEQAATQFEQTQDQIDHLVCDPTGVIGRLYGAQTTPHVYLIDPSGRLIYQGAIDSIASTRARDVTAAKNYLMAAFQQSRRHQKVDPSTTTPYGCSVKYAQPK